MNVNVNVSVHSLKFPLSSADFNNLRPWYWNSLLCSLISSGENLQFAHFAAAIASFLVPLGTHHCWVDRGGVIWEACPTPLHMTVSVAMCYHCVRVAVGPHRHVSAVPDVLFIPCPLGQRHISSLDWRRHFLSSRESNSGLLHDRRVF